MQKIKNMIVSATLAFPIIFNLAPGLVYAANPAKDAIQKGVCDASGQDPCDSATATTSLNNTIESVINILSILVGVVAVIMIIVAGFRYVASGGNDQAIAGAKKTLLYALVGLVLVALAQIIVRFVLKNVT